jgi:hypothetical protein
MYNVELELVGDPVYTRIELELPLICPEPFMRPPHVNVVGVFVPLPFISKVAAEFTTFKSPEIERFAGIETTPEVSVHQIFL